MNDRKMVKTEIGKRELDNLRELLLHPDRDRLTPWEVVEIAADDLAAARAELVRVRQEADDRQVMYDIHKETAYEQRLRAEHAEFELAAVRVRADQAEQSAVIWRGKFEEADEECGTLRHAIGECPTPCDDDCDDICHEGHAIPLKRYHAPSHHNELKALRVRADTAEARLAEKALGRLVLDQSAEITRLRGVLQQVQERAEIEIADAKVGESYHAETDNGVGLIGEQTRRAAWETVARLLRPARSVSGSANPTLNSQETFQGSVLRANPKQED